MYKPVRDGIAKDIKSVIYNEVDPPEHLKQLAHCFWELKTLSPLAEDFKYHVLPDACVNILFDQKDSRITDITALQTEHKTLNLGKDFHFVGAQLLPGVWKGELSEIKNDLVNQPYSGKLSLVEMNTRLIKKSTFKEKQTVLTQVVEDLIKDKLLDFNLTISSILANIDLIKNVAGMAKTAGLSPRQLQRQIKQTLGLTPHDFLKVIRLQNTFRHNYLDYYADQSHFIHSFSKITGLTPIKYIKKYNV